jgi:hypothetical protein
MKKKKLIALNGSGQTSDIMCLTGNVIIFKLILSKLHLHLVSHFAWRFISCILRS